MRILWLSFVDAEQNAPYFERLSRYLNDIAAQDTTVDVAGTSPPDRDFSRLTEFRCAALAIDRCIQAEAQGFDAFVMGHFQDPGLYAARSAVRIPVVATGEATLHLAAQLGRWLGLVRAAAALRDAAARAARILRRARDHHRGSRYRSLYRTAVKGSFEQFLHHP